MVVGEQFGVRITEIRTPRERISVSGKPPFSGAGLEEELSMDFSEYKDVFAAEAGAHSIAE